ncbi:MAG: sugar transferase [Thermoleophilia bacterium]|nr:sugar transferase [Thermoleophilia bacterium]
MKNISDRAAWMPERPEDRRVPRPRRLLLVTDVVSGVLAVLLMWGVLRWRDASVDQTAISVLMGGLVVLFSLGLMMRAGQYSNRARLSPLSDTGTLFRDMIIAASIATLLSYVTKGYGTGLTTPSRVAVVCFAATFFVLGVAGRAGLSAHQRRQYAQGRSVRRILVLGTGPAAEDFVRFVENRPWLGIAVAGRLAYGNGANGNGNNHPPGAAGAADTPGAAAAYGAPAAGAATGSAPGGGLPITRLADGLRGLRSLDQALRSTQATEVVVALDAEDQAHMPKVASLLSLAHVPFKVVPSLFEQTYRTTELLGYAEIPVIDVEVDPLDRVARFTKRVLDLAVASVMIVVLALPLLGMIVAIVAETGFPVFYKHERVGRNGRRFIMYKFRTMVKDADERFKDVQAQNEAEFSEGRIFKMRKDPRVTRVGSVLRKTSADELPQLINVLKGQMSVVGPRPPLPREVAKYERDHLYRLRAMPGITGLWQVSGRSDLDFDDMIRLDRYYLDHWSVAMDLSILLKTFWVVISRKGAY